jgi:hypothetical protein
MTKEDIDTIVQGVGEQHVGLILAILAITKQPGFDRSLFKKDLGFILSSCGVTGNTRTIIQVFIDGTTGLG